MKSPIGKDLVLLIKGLGKLSSAAVDLKSNQIYKLWANSSLKPLSEESLSSVQNTFTNSTFLSQTEVFKRVSDTYERLTVVKESVDAYVTQLNDKDTAKEFGFQDVSSSELGIGEVIKAPPDRTRSSSSSTSFISGIYGNENRENILNNLDSVSSNFGASAAHTISKAVEKTKSEVKSKLKDIQPIIRDPSDFKEITNDQMEAIDKKLLELQGLEYSQDFKVFSEVGTEDKESTEAKIYVDNSSSQTDQVSHMEFPQKIQPLTVQSSDIKYNGKEKPKLIGSKPLAKSKAKSTLSSDAQARKVPQTRISRLVTFGGLAAGLGMGTLAELTRRTLGVKSTNQSGALLDASPFLTEANAKRIVDTLCKVRGAALKLGQMLSIQDNSMINPHLQKVFERVRQSADFMPTWQLERTLVKDFGPDWRTRLFSFDDRPFAAASIGQVHQAMLHDGRSVAMKIQYPGVAEGIESDINNLIGTLTVANILPEGLFVDALIEVAKRELKWECDYIREKECTKRFRRLVEPHSEYYVPEVIEEFCTQQVFTAELIDGIAVDKCVTFDQETRNHISSLVLKLCLMEIFEFKFMQTDPNWSNFFYNQDTNQIALLDFGACREYSTEFVDKYIQIIHGASIKDREKVHEYSRQLGFLTGYEAKVMVDAHIDAVMILGEAFQHDEPFSFGDQNTTRRIQQLVPILLTHRMCPPPEESYSLHRKMSGVFLLCAKLDAKINCKPFFDGLWQRYNITSG